MQQRLFGLVMSTAFLGALMSQVYVPLPDWHLYFVECGIFAAFLFGDGVIRRTPIGALLMHTAAALVLAPLVVPRWYANRPLLPGEWRKGGSEMNFFQAFAIVTVVFTGVSAASNFLNFGPDRGFELIINSGFCVAGTAIVLGLIARNDRLLEKGAPAAAAVREQNEKIDN